MNYVISLLLAVAFALPVAAKGVYPCYGEREKWLAHALLVTVPFLGISLEQQEGVAKRVRNETCAIIAQTGRVGNIDNTFFDDSKNRLIRIVAEANGLEPLRLQAALVDAHWPPKTM